MEVSGLGEVTSITAGNHDSFAVRSDGTVMAWGDDNAGQLGDGATAARDVPFQISGLSGVKSIAADKGDSEATSTVALRTNGTVLMWGGASRTPTEVKGIIEATAVAAGAGFGLALLGDGHVMSFSSTTNAAEVPGLSGVTAISASAEQHFAVLASGSVMAWGNGVSGALGNGSFSSAEPSGVCGLTGVTSVSSGDEFSVAYSPNPETIPAVMSISRKGGSPFGGNTVTITGEHLEGATSVHFGPNEATGVKVNSDTSLEAVSPAGEGTVPVTVTSAEGTSVTCDADRYHYTELPKVGRVNPIAATAGTTVTITGTELAETTAADFGSTPATSWSLSPGGGSIKAIAPAGSGQVNVTVTNTAGTSPTNPFDLIVLVTPPEYGRCEKVEPTGGPHYSASTRLALANIGSYEWFPGFEGPEPLVKAGFTTAIKPATTLTLLTTGKHTITCSGAAGSGSYTGPKTTGLSLKLTGCKMGEASCTSAGAAAGEVLPAALVTEVGVITKGTEAKTNKLGIALRPASGETIASFSCGATSVVLTGSSIAALTGDTMTTTATDKFTEAKGIQKPTRFQGGPEAVLHATVGGGAPEQAGLGLTLVQSSEEKVELNAVI